MVRQFYYNNGVMKPKIVRIGRWIVITLVPNMVNIKPNPDNIKNMMKALREF